MSYVPSGSVLAILRRRDTGQLPPRTALAISASPVNESTPDGDHSARPWRPRRPAASTDLDLGTLPALPSANDEARAVGSLMGEKESTILLGDAATESAVKRLPLDDYRVLHFAVHGILSTKEPSGPRFC